MISAGGCSTDQPEDAVVHCRRRLEETMVIIRWIAVFLCLLILLLVPPPFMLLGALVTAGLAAGNLATMFCLRRAYRPRCYLLIGGVASALEWLVALGMAMACSATAFNPLPAALIILLIVDGVRYGLAGVIGAGIAAVLGVGSMIALQITAWRVLRPTAGMILLARWEALIFAAAMVIGFFLWIGQERLRQEWSQREEAQVMIQRLQEEKLCWEAENAAIRRRLDEEERRWHAEHIALQRFTLGISPREWEVLLLLAEDRTYAQIAEHLSIDIETVRTHLRHLAAKLDANGTGRQAITTAAREQSLLL